MIRIPVEHQVDPAWVPDAPLEPPASHGGLVDVFRRRYLLRLLVRKEIQARYAASALGMLWSYIKPAVQFTMYYFVIGQILGLHKDVELFGIHIFAGFVFAHFFTESFTAGTRSIVQNRSILKKMPLPREMFPVSSMLVSAFHVIPGLILLTAASALNGWQVDAGAVAGGLLALMIVALWGTAAALAFAAANVFFRDFSNVVQTLTMFVTFSVPMIYPYSKVQERFGDLAHFYLYNPMAEVVLLSQRLFWVPATEDPAQTAAAHLPSNLMVLGLIHLLVAAVALVVAQMIFSRLEKKFPERL